VVGWGLEWVGGGGWDWKTQVVVLAKARVLVALVVV
jgi:hypothetical protein